MNKQILEKDITKTIRKHLNSINIFHWKQWQGLGSTKGTPDIVGVLPVSIKTLNRLGIKRVGLFLGIEVKTAKGKVTDHQTAFLNAIKAAGGLAIVARSVQDIEHLKKMVENERKYYWKVYK